MQEELSKLPQLLGRLTGRKDGTPETIHCSQLTPVFSSLNILPSSLHTDLSPSVTSCPPAIPNKTRQKPKRRPARSRQSCLTRARASAELCPSLQKAEPPACLRICSLWGVGVAGGAGQPQSQAGNIPAADALQVGLQSLPSVILQLSLAALPWS